MKYLKIIFNFISFISIIYLFFILYDDLSEVNFRDIKFIKSFIQSVCFSMLAYFFIFLCFFIICKQFRKDIVFLQIFKLMSTSQIYKYIPGNIFHYLKRYEFFSKLNIDKHYIKVNSYELFLYIFAGAIFFPLIFINNLFLLLILVVFLIFIYYFIPVKNYLKITFLLYIFSHLFFLIGFLLIFNANDINTDFYDFMHIGSVFTVSKIIGTLVPGSPSGLGLSELLVFLAKFDFLLVSMLIFRLVILTSEILLFFISFFLGRDFTK